MQLENTCCVPSIQGSEDILAYSERKCEIPGSESGLFVIKYKLFLGSPNSLNVWRNVLWHKTEKQSTSLNESASISREQAKPTATHFVYPGGVKSRTSGFKNFGLRELHFDVAFLTVFGLCSYAGIQSRCRISNLAEEGRTSFSSQLGQVTSLLLLLLLLPPPPPPHAISSSPYIITLYTYLM